MTLNDIKARCRIDEETGCWVWTGAMTSDGPVVWAPATPGGKKMAVRARRLIWPIVKGTKTPARVYVTCDCKACMNPAHLAGGTVKQHGAFIAKTGKLLNSVKRKAAARARGRMLTSLTPEKVAIILASDKPGTVLGPELGINHQTVSDVRTGRRGLCFQPIGSVFSQLLR